MRFDLSVKNQGQSFRLSSEAEAYSLAEVDLSISACPPNHQVSVKKASIFAPINLRFLKLPRKGTFSTDFE